MKRFSLSIIFFYIGLVLLGIFPGRSTQHIALAASVRDDMSLLHSEAPGVAFSLRADYG